MTKSVEGREHAAVTSGAQAFEQIAGQYDSQLSQGLRLAGEGAEYFAGRRAEYTRRLADHHGIKVQCLLDFGCGIGTSLPVLAEAFPQARIIGYEPADHLRQICQERFAASGLHCISSLDEAPANSVDLIYCSGVFHHIPPTDRPEVMQRARRLLTPSGGFCLWENNPWSPAARLVMSRIPFDRDAVMVWPGQARQLLQSAELAVTQTRYLFIFPRRLSRLRILERPLERCALGAQYVVFARCES
jgi:trans-aconitate methyltransferase